ncbi:MAG: pirin family protein [Hyphomonadaceae bacterium]|nr:pirin family protein [Hyphomonadaceae bacterium]MBX3509811.1 pirin family protein [Hyphomonadaceae bacterium]
MSTRPGDEQPPRTERDGEILTITPKPRDLGGGFSVRRALPAIERRMVGPFIFWDEFGPAHFAAGEGLDVRPHPHINLATVTYLFEGEIFHRDTLGSAQAISPGDVNWMNAGRGIAHSERTRAELRKGGSPIAGIQSWLALPEEHEESAPFFVHHAQADLPVIEEGGKIVRVIAGKLYGKQSPVRAYSTILYADAQLAHAGVSMPLDAEHEERGLYLVKGEIEIAGDVFTPGRLLVFRPGDHITIKARTPARFMLLGGDNLGPRHLWWNFVSSRKERIEQAKEDWKAGRFGTVPGDEKEFIPLPD